MIYVKFGGRGAQGGGWRGDVCWCERRGTSAICIEPADGDTWRRTKRFEGPEQGRNESRSSDTDDLALAGGCAAR